LRLRRIRELTSRTIILAVAALALLLPGFAAAQTASSNPFRPSPDAPPPSAVQPPYPAIHDLPPPRATQPLNSDEQLRLERELSGIRARHEKLRDPEAKSRPAKPKPGSH
jgi:hypothetical protein